MRRMIFTGLGVSLLALISAQAMAAMLLHQQRSPMPRSLGPVPSHHRWPAPNRPIVPQPGVKKPICNWQISRGVVTKIPMSQLPPPGLCTGKIVGSLCVTCYRGMIVDPYCIACRTPGYVFKSGQGCCPAEKLPIPK
jgi:hypothetical protein